MPKWCEHAILESEHIEMERDAQYWRELVEYAIKHGYTHGSVQPMLKQIMHTIAIVGSGYYKTEAEADNWRAIVECAKREGNARKPGRMDLIADDDMIDIILDVIRGHFRRVEEVEKLRAEVKQLKLRLEGLEK